MLTLVTQSTTGLIILFKEAAANVIRTAHYAPCSLQSVVERIAEMSPDSFQALESQIAAPTAFEIGIDEQKELASECNLSVEQFQYLIAALSFLYDRLDQFDSEETSRSDQIILLVKELNIHENDEDKRNKSTSRLQSLLKENKKNKIYKKIRRLQKGFIPSAVGFSSFVDL